MKQFDGPNPPIDVPESAPEIDDLSSMLLVAAREMSESVIITNRDFVVLWSNAAATRISGYSAEELCGNNVLEMARAYVSAPEVAADLTATLAAGQRFSSRQWSWCKNGEKILLDFEVIPYRGKNSDIVAYIGIARDVTAQTLAENALQESEAHLRHAHEMIGLGSWRCEVETKKIEWSPQIHRMFGRPLERGNPTFEEYLAYIHPDDREKLLPLMRQAIETGKNFEMLCQINREDGSTGYLHGRANTRLDDSGKVIELFGTTQDVTQRVKAERERLELHARLASAQRLESLGLLAGGIAHDFNNLLMGVMMTASVIEKEVAAHSTIGEAVSSIQQAAERMAELTNQLLAYAGRGRFVLERVDPNEVTRTMLDSLRQTLNPEIKIDAEIADPPSIVEIDSTQLRHVITNLISNAVDALEGTAGTIKVRTHFENKSSNVKSWVLEVIDSGTGMPEDVQRRIFEPFFTTKPRGRGLGLSTVHGLVQRSRGSIDVESILGKGTRFSLRLPLIESGKIIEEVPARVSAEARATRVLVADDEAMVRRSLRRMLELHKMRVVEVADGASAIEAMNAATEPFDLALVDIVMPRMTGYEVLAEVRTQKLTTKVILMSGFNNIDELDGAKPSYDADAMLQKPFAWNELRRAVQSVLGNDDSAFVDKR